MLSLRDVLDSRRIQAGEYMLAGGLWHAQKEPHAYTCEKQHRMRNGGHCGGGCIHFTQQWALTHLGTGMRLEQGFRTLRQLKEFIERETETNEREMQREYR